VGVVVAIDPGQRLGKVIDRLTTDLRGHDIVIATTGDEALELLDLQVPDLMLFPLFLSPGDDARLQQQLEALTTPADLRTLTLPLQSFFEGEAQGARPAAVPPRWFYWFRPEAGAGYDIDDAVAFAQIVRTELGRPRPAASGRTEAAAELRSVMPLPFMPPPPAVPPPSPSALVAAPVFAMGVDGVGAPSVRAFDTSPSHPTPSPSYDLSTVTPPSSTSDVDMSAPLESTTQAAREPGPSRAAAVLSVVVAAAGGAFRLLARLASLIGPASAGVWRMAQGMPRAGWVAVPAVMILLSLGVTGRIGSLVRAPLRLASSTKARFFPDKAKTGTAEIQSVPDGAQVWMNGRQIGVTPMRAEFAVGSHQVELRHRGTVRSLLLDILPGATVVQRIEWAAPQAAIGRLRIESDPAGAAVAIDGKTRGVTPLTVDDLTAGRHTVDFTLQGNAVRETVDVRSGRTTTLRSSVYQGWLALFSPIELNTAFNGRPLVLDDQNRALLPAGQHELTLQNTTLGFLETRTIAIKPGETTAVSVTLPTTAFTVTTSAPAEVWVDGNRVGDAPIVDLAIEIGTHDVLVRSAERGERRIAFSATVEPVRLAIDFDAPAP
jgi:hypothetical protein